MFIIKKIELHGTKKIELHGTKKNELMEWTLINLPFFMTSLDTKDDFTIARHKIGQFLTKS